MCSRSIAERLFFFLPRRLVELQYLGGTIDKEYAELAKPYRKEIDFAFFAVNFGYSKRDYVELTPVEKTFIMKAWEDKRLSASYDIYNAVFVANYNLNRKKSKRALQLWKKSSTSQADLEIIRNNLSIIREVEKKEGTSWIDLVYRKNGLKKPERREGSECLLQTKV